MPVFIKNNLLLKITSLNSVAMSIRMVIAFASQKIIAVLLGPEGIAVIGNIRSLIPMIESFSTLGTFNGVVKYVSQYKDDKKELQQLFSTTAVYTFCASIISFIILFFGSEKLNYWLFLEEGNYEFIFQLLAVAVPFLALNRLFNGVMNGLSAYQKFVKINLLSYAVSALLVIVAAFYKSVGGALFAIALTPIIQFIILFYFYYAVLKEYIFFKNLQFAIPYKNKLFAFTLMSIVATFLGSFVDIKLRTHLMKSISVNDAGYWTGMTNISKQYLMFSSAILTLYVIPKFATITNSKLFRKEIFNIYKVLLPLFALGMLTVFVLREWVILILKSEAFLGMMPLFKWQLMGDFVKLMSIILAHQFLAKKMVISFILSEILSLILFYSFANYFIESMGAEGVVFAHFLRYVVYFGVVVFLLRKHIFGNQEIKP